MSKNGKHRDALEARRELLRQAIGKAVKDHGEEATMKIASRVSGLRSCENIEQVRLEIPKLDINLTCVFISALKGLNQKQKRVSTNKYADKIGVLPVKKGNRFVSSANDEASYQMQATISDGSAQPQPE